MPGVDGMHKAAPMAQSQVRSRMWNSMRRLRQFTRAEVEATAEAGTSHAMKYIKALSQAGYLRIVVAKQQGIPGGHTVYQIVRDTGPHAPRIGKAGLLDPNLEPAPPEPGDELVSLKRRDYDRLLACARACAGMQDPEAEMKALRGGCP